MLAVLSTHGAVQAGRFGTQVEKKTAADDGESCHGPPKGDADGCCKHTDGDKGADMQEVSDPVRNGITHFAAKAFPNQDQVGDIDH